jgi:KRAB domain-containing zinc finger protein
MRFLKKYQCDVCSTKFSKQEQLMQHQQVVHFKDNPYDCKECDMNFSNMEDMRTHLQREHSYKKER